MDVQQRLEELLSVHGIPGASVAILENDRIVRFNAGVANIATAEPVRDSTIFPIGSITKLFTTCLILQLVEHGRLSLDQTVLSCLPDLEIINGCISNRILIRDLLTHSSGIPGDFLYDPGTDGNAIELYTQKVAELPSLHQPGELFSYSNAAFVVAGRIIEQETTKSWHEVMRTSLIEPLGLTSVSTLPPDRSNPDTGAPHVRQAGNTAPQVGDMWPEFHAGAPAGFTTYANSADVVEFARFHLRSDQSLLSQSSLEEMQQPQVTSLPSGSFDAIGWGLGWALHRYGKERVIGHNGGTSAMLRVLPHRQFAVAVLTNISGGIRLGQQLIVELVRERLGIETDSMPETAGWSPGDFSELEGRYQHLGYWADIRAFGKTLNLKTGSDSRFDDRETALLPLRSGEIRADFPDRGPSRVGFVTTHWGEDPDYFHMGLRAYRRDSN